MMKKLVPILQLLASGILALVAIATLINLVLIINRPETISVINAMIGQGVIIVALLALARILYRRSRQGLRAPTEDKPEL
jgi:hypothetical protein